MGYHVVKDPTPYYLKWHVMSPTGIFVTRYATKIDAEIDVEIRNGDRSRAPLGYQRTITRAKKRMSDRDAIRYAGMWARGLNLWPCDVAENEKWLREHP